MREYTGPNTLVERSEWLGKCTGSSENTQDNFATYRAQGGLHGVNTQDRSPVQIHVFSQDTPQNAHDIFLRIGRDVPSKLS